MGNGLKNALFPALAALAIGGIADEGLAQENSPQTDIQVCEPGNISVSESELLESSIQLETLGTSRFKLFTLLTFIEGANGTISIASNKEFEDAFKARIGVLNGTYRDFMKQYMDIIIDLINKRLTGVEPERLDERINELAKLRMDSTLLEILAPNIAEVLYVVGYPGSRTVLDDLWARSDGQLSLLYNGIYEANSIVSSSYPLLSNQLIITLQKDPESPLAIEDFRNYSLRVKEHRDRIINIIKCAWEAYGLSTNNLIAAFNNGLNFMPAILDPYYRGGSYAGRFENDDSSIYFTDDDNSIDIYRINPYTAFHEYAHYLQHNQFTFINVDYMQPKVVIHHALIVEVIYALTHYDEFSTEYYDFMNQLSVLAYNTGVPNQNKQVGYTNLLNILETYHGVAFTPEMTKAEIYTLVAYYFSNSTIPYYTFSVDAMREFEAEIMSIILTERPNLPPEIAGIINQFGVLNNPYTSLRELYLRKIYLDQFREQ